MSEIVAAPDIQLPPTQAELPYDDNENMETQRHKFACVMLHGSNFAKPKPITILQ